MAGLSMDLATKDSSHAAAEVEEETKKKKTFSPVFSIDDVDELLQHNPVIREANYQASLSIHRLMEIILPIEQADYDEEDSGRLDDSLPTLVVDLRKLSVPNIGRIYWWMIHFSCWSHVPTRTEILPLHDFMELIIRNFPCLLCLLFSTSLFKSIQSGKHPVIRAPLDSKMSRVDAWQWSCQFHEETNTHAKKVIEDLPTTDRGGSSSNSSSRRDGSIRNSSSGIRSQNDRLLPHSATAVTIVPTIEPPPSPSLIERTQYWNTVFTGTRDSVLRPISTIPVDVWSKGYWSMIHCVAWTLPVDVTWLTKHTAVSSTFLSINDQEYPPETVRLKLSLLREIIYRLPCGVCLSTSRAVLRVTPFPTIVTRRSLWRWSVKFHNRVRVKLDLPYIHYRLCTQTWTRIFMGEEMTTTHTITTITTTTTVATTTATIALVTPHSSLS